MNDVERPATYEAAVEHVAAHAPDGPLPHHGVGTAVRNNLGLWDKTSPLHQHMLQRFGLCHADDMSGLILTAVEAQRANQSYDPNPDVDRYKAHWRQAGYDPATMERLKP